MTRRIFKYTLDITDEQVVEFPGNPIPLSVQDQPGSGHRDLMLWAIVDDDKPTVTRRIRIFGTGHPLPDQPGCYIGTVQKRGLVWHVFMEWAPS